MNKTAQELSASYLSIFFITFTTKILYLHRSNNEMQLHQPYDSDDLTSIRLLMNGDVVCFFKLDSWQRFSNHRHTDDDVLSLLVGFSISLFTRLHDVQRRARRLVQVELCNGLYEVSSATANVHFHMMLAGAVGDWTHSAGESGSYGISESQPSFLKQYYEFDQTDERMWWWWWSWW